VTAITAVNKINHVNFRRIATSFLRHHSATRKENIGHLDCWRQRVLRGHSQVAVVCRQLLCFTVVRVTIPLPGSDRASNEEQAMGEDLPATPPSAKPRRAPGFLGGKRGLPARFGRSATMIWTLAPI